MQTARKSDQAAEVETFYVIMDCSTQRFLSRDEDWDVFGAAMRFPTSERARFELAGDYSDSCRVVGPCMEGEEP